MIKNLTIKIRNISEGKEIGFCATVKELGNSIVMADSIEEIFDLMPDLIDSSQKNNIGIFKKKTFQAKSKKGAAKK